MSRSSQIETEIERIACQVIGVGGIGPNEDLLELGADSIMGSDILARIEEIYDVALPIEDILDNLTVRGIAEVVEQQLSAVSRSTGSS